MAVLNRPVSKTERVVTVTEWQFFGKKSRSRRTTWTTTRWIGSDYDGAKAKMDSLTANPNNDGLEINLEPQSAGFWDCVVTQKTVADWTAWA